MIFNILSNFNIVLGIAFFSTIPLFFYQKRKKNFLLFPLLFLNIYSLNYTEKSTTFLYLLTSSSVIIFFISLLKKSGKSHNFQFSRYLTYIIADICFLFLSINFIEYLKYFIYLPIIVHGNLIPFNFFSFCGERKFLKFEFKLTMLSYLILYIFLSKYNIDKPTISFLIIITALLSSFRLVKSNSSTNIIISIFSICMQLTLLILVNNYLIFANISFAYFSVLFFLISIFSPDYISETTIKHNSTISLNFLKFISLILIFSVSLFPFVFSSTFFLSIFEITSFQTWSSAQTNSFKPLVFILTALFCLNLSWGLMFASKLILHSPDKAPMKKHVYMFFFFIVSIFLIFSNFFLFNNLTFLNTSNHIPLSIIKENLSIYILYFYSPLVLFSIIGLYLQHLCHDLSLIQKPYSLFYNLFSFDLVFKKLKFLYVQNNLLFFGNKIHDFFKVLPYTCKNIRKYAINSRNFLILKFRSFLLILKELINYKINNKDLSSNLHIIIILFISTIISFSVNMESSISYSIIIAAISIFIAFILTSINGDLE